MADHPVPEAHAAVPTVAETGTAKGDVSVLELSRTQRTVARRIAESKATVPEFTLSAEVDMEAAVAALAALAQDGPEVVPTPDDLVVKAAALALRDVPRANGSYRDGRFEQYSRVNIGVTVIAHDSLVVPTIFDADGKPVEAIARETVALAEQARAGEITSAQLSGATFTVSSLAAFGVAQFAAIITAPQAATLAVGATAPRAVVRDGAVVARHALTATLTCDHRLLYGADAGRLLARIRELLEQPAPLLS